MDDMKFKDALLNAMCELNLNQTQVVGMTGCSKASISQYLSGKNTPSEQKQRDIAEALGFEPDYFQWADSNEKAVLPKKIATSDSIQTMIPADAAKLMHMDVATIRRGLQQGVFPWGYGIHMTSGKWVYFINARRFAEIEGGGK